MIKILKILLFYPLLWVRRLALGLERFFGGIFLLGFLMSFMIPDFPFLATIVMIVMGVSSIVICHFYDQVLLKLNPTDNELILFQ